MAAIDRVAQNGTVLVEPLTLSNIISAALNSNNWHWHFTR